MMHETEEGEKLTLPHYWECVNWSDCVKAMDEGLRDIVTRYSAGCASRQDMLDEYCALHLEKHKVHFRV